MITVRTLLLLASTLLVVGHTSLAAAQSEETAPEPPEGTAPPGPAAAPEETEDDVQEGEVVEDLDAQIEDEATEAPATDEDESETAEPSGDESEEAEGGEEAAEAESAARARATLPAPGETTRLTPAPEPPAYRFLLPPVLIERSPQVRTTAVFPLFYSHATLGDDQLLVGPYYRRRSERLHADVAFPFFWSFRGVDDTTTVVPPVYHHVGSEGFDFGIAPLFFTGTGKKSSYTVIPPLLTATWSKGENTHTFAGLFWRIRQRERHDWGVFPFLWVADKGYASRVLAPPLFFRFTDEDEDSALTIAPPFYHSITPDRVRWGAAPLLLHSHGPDFTSWTVPPLLFHYSQDGGDLRLVTPLFGYFGVGGHQTLITPVYQRHRGDTELDAVAPFFFSWRDPRENASGLVVPPLFWHFQSPADSSTVLFPFFGLWQEHGVSTTWATPLAANWRSHTRNAGATWIFPTLQFSHTPTSSTFNLHPLVYSTEARKHRHLVVAPLYWDFEDYEDKSRTTILFPLLWRFRDGNDVTQLAGNTFYRAGARRGVPFWEMHVFPLVTWGSTGPGDHFWQVLYGLAGYRRQGEYAKVSVFWVPITVDEPEQEAALPAPTARASLQGRRRRH